MPISPIPYNKQSFYVLFSFNFELKVALHASLGSVQSAVKFYFSSQKLLEFFYMSNIFIDSFFLI